MRSSFVRPIVLVFWAACSSNPRTNLADQHAQNASADLEKQVAAVRSATERYRDFANAQRDGYKLFGKEGPLMGEHWYRADIVKAPLDLKRPSTLQYATINGKRE